MEMNADFWIGSLALILSSISLILSGISLKQQFFHKEIVAYPLIEGGSMYLCVENVGQSTVMNFTVEIVNMDSFLSTIEISDAKKKAFINRDGLNGKSTLTLASKKIRKFYLASYKDFYLKKHSEHDANSKAFPNLKVRLKYKTYKYRKKVVQDFDCDYNSYRNESSPYTIVEKLDDIHESMNSIKK